MKCPARTLEIEIYQQEGVSVLINPLNPLLPLDSYRESWMTTLPPHAPLSTLMLRISSLLDTKDQLMINPEYNARAALVEGMLLNGETAVQRYRDLKLPTEVLYATLERKRRRKPKTPRSTEDKE